MKKVVFILIVFFVVISSVSASNLQGLYTVDDNIYKRVEIITRRAGVVGPSSFSPVPASALVLALERVDISKLSELELKEYNEILSNLTSTEQDMVSTKNFRLNLGLGLNVGATIADYDEFNYRHGPDRRYEVVIPYNKEDAALSFYPKMYFGNSVFLEGEFIVKNNSYEMGKTTFSWIDQFHYAPDMPYRADLSAGNDYFNFMIGRVPHSIGSGITGNMLAGDNFRYQETLGLSFFSRYFTYNMSVTRFDQEEYFKDSGDLSKVILSRREFTGAQTFRVIHRFDMNFFDVVRLAVDMSTIYNGDSGFDFRFLIPFFLQHNYYNYTNYQPREDFDEANNLMNFSLEINPAKGLMISAQFALDQFQTYFEDQTSMPAAWGVLANIKYTHQVKSGWLNFWAEGVYTNPYLYLNRKVDKNNINKVDLNLDYVVGYHTQYVAELGFSGYLYGPDSIVFALGYEYVPESNNWSAGLNFMYKIQGKKRLNYSVSDIHNTVWDESAVVIEVSPDIYMNAKTPTGGIENAEHLIKIAAFGDYTFDNLNLTLYAAACVNTYFNYNNDHGVTKVLPQATIGVKWTGINMNWFD